MKEMQMDPSCARRDLDEVQALQLSAVVTTVQRRWLWTVAGLVVFAASMLNWLSGPGPVNIMFLALILLGALTSLLGRTPRWAGLLGKRARLAGEQAGKVHWLITVTLLSVAALYFILSTAVLVALGNTYPIAGPFLGLTLALGGPRFARWWFRKDGNRG